MHDEFAERHVTRPGGLLLMVWGVVAFFSFYGADVVRDEVEKTEWLQGQTWLVDGLTAVMKSGDAIGLSALKEGLGGARATVNEAYTVLEKSSPVVIPPITVIAPPDPEAPSNGGGEGTPAIQHVGPLRPQRVLVIGASSIQFAIGGELERRMPEYQGVTVKRFGKLATGLSRPDFFDWPKQFRKLAKSFRPDLVLANFGGNGAQSIPAGKYEKIKWKSPGWDEAYGNKVKEMVAIADEVNAKMVFLGMPVMRSPKFTKKMRHLNRVQAEAAEAAGALFVSTEAMSSLPGGAYRKTVRVGKKRGLMRTSDGVHYTKLGARYVVERVMRQVEREVRLVPDEAELAVAERHALLSLRLERELAYVAYVPRNASDVARRPAVLLFPDPDDGWSTDPTAWPHRQLQTLAEKEDTVLVVVPTPPEGWWVGPLQDVLVEELLPDVKRYLPVHDDLAAAGAGKGAIAAIGLALRAPQTVGRVSLFGGPTDLPAQAADDTQLQALLGDPVEALEAWRRADPASSVDPERHAGLRLTRWGAPRSPRIEAALKGVGAQVETKPLEGSWGEHLQDILPRTSTVASPSSP